MDLLTIILISAVWLFFFIAIGFMSKPKVMLVLMTISVALCIILCVINIVEILNDNNEPISSDVIEREGQEYERKDDVIIVDGYIYERIDSSSPEDTPSVIIFDGATYKIT